MLLSHLQIKESTEREFIFAETDTWLGKQMKLLRVLLAAASFIQGFALLFTEYLNEILKQT